MFWLTLLLVWAAASIVVALAWGKLVSSSQDSADERPDSAPGSGLHANAEASSPDCPRRSSHR